MTLPSVKVATPDDGSILIEWIHKHFRVGISLESNVRESSWYLVSDDTLDSRMDCGYILDNDFSESVSKMAKLVSNYIEGIR